MSRMQGRVKVKACTQLRVDKNNLRNEKILRRYSSNDDDAFVRERRSR